MMNVRDSPGSGASAVPRRATIKDVAAEAGVSVAAVSKVLRNAYGVSDAMRVQVTAAIDRLGYRPRASARTMRGSGYTIGVVLVDFDSPFQFEVARAVAHHLESTPYQDVLTIAGTSPAAQHRRIEALQDREVDGLVLIAPRLEADWLKALGRQVPTVTVALHGEPTSYDAVTTEEQQSVDLMVEHLASMGHEHIVHATMPSEAVETNYLLSHTVRRRAFEKSMAERGLRPEIIETYYSEEGGRRAAQGVLERRDRPSAIFAGSDMTAFGVLDYAEARGFSVPESLSVAGYDNVSTSSIGRISLTTIDQSGYETGNAAASLLLERISGRLEPSQHVVTPQLMVRKTTGPLSD